MDRSMLELLLMGLLVISALWTVVTSNLLRSVIGLALTSATLSIIMYLLDSPLASVFELSVCAGLISVILFSAITLTERLTSQRLIIREKEVFLRRFWILPILLVIAVILLSGIGFNPPPVPVQKIAAPQDAREVIWQMRQLDIIGQISILLAGAFGVVLLFKRSE
jgi:NADH-quinone oxidoreductase subunit J